MPSINNIKRSLYVRRYKNTPVGSYLRGFLFSWVSLSPYFSGRSQPPIQTLRNSSLNVSILSILNLTSVAPSLCALTTNPSLTLSIPSYSASSSIARTNPFSHSFEGCTTAFGLVPLRHHSITPFFGTTFIIIPSVVHNSCMVSESYRVVKNIRFFSKC